MFLTDRLRASMKDNRPETLLFNTYYESFLEKLKDRLPALIPQVYLHYDPYTWKNLKGEKRLVRQRMDFLLLLPYGKNVVIEIDGKQHYSEKWQHSEKWQARPDLYAEMVAEDRQLKLTGYEVYRFGGYELQESKKPKQTITDFFSELFKVHYIS